MIQQKVGSNKLKNFKGLTLRKVNIFTRKRASVPFLKDSIVNFLSQGCMEECFDIKGDGKHEHYSRFRNARTYSAND